MKRRERRFFSFATALLSGLFVLTGCQKNTASNFPVITDAQAIRLKEVTIRGLPSPYLRLKYDAQNFITEIGYESGTYLYIPAYKNGRLHKMVNTAFAEHDTLYYYYSGDQVSRIDWVAVGNGKREETFFSYDNRGRLTTAAWKKVNQLDFYKRQLFFYNQQDNMVRCDIFYDLGTGLEKTNMYLFDQFDDKENLTSNELLKEYHLLFLPQVRLQKNNPLSAHSFGLENDFNLQYSYQYNRNLPVSKTTLMTQTRGSGAGNSIVGETSYSYY